VQALGALFVHGIGHPARLRNATGHAILTMLLTVNGDLFNNRAIWCSLEVIYVLDWCEPRIRIISMTRCASSFEARLSLRRGYINFDDPRLERSFLRHSPVP
jgi:hypothetical protein